MSCGQDLLPFDAFADANKARPVRAVVPNVILMFELTIALGE